jgi:ribonuclease HI
MPYFAVKIGAKTGIFMSWLECQRYIRGYPRAHWRVFTLKRDAEIFLEKGIATILPCRKQTVTAEDKKEALKEYKEVEKTKEEESANRELEPKQVMANYSKKYPRTMNVYCSGYSRYNAGSYGICFGLDDERNVFDRVPSDVYQSENSGEFLAIERALEVLKGVSVRGRYTDVIIRTENEYAVRACNELVHGWLQYGWKHYNKTAVKDKSLIRKIHTGLKNFRKITLELVKTDKSQYNAHSIGCQEAARLSRAGLSRPMKQTQGRRRRR